MKTIAEALPLKNEVYNELANRKIDKQRFEAKQKAANLLANAAKQISFASKITGKSFYDTAYSIAVNEVAFDELNQIKERLNQIKREYKYKLYDVLETI